MFGIGNFGFYVGDQKLNSIELVKLAKLDYLISLHDVYVEINQERIKANNYKAVARDLDNKIYAIVGNSFSPIQNIDAFEFLDVAAKENVLEYHTIGSIGDGAKVFLFAKFGSFSAGGENYDKHIMVSNAHDGSSCLKCSFVLVRTQTGTPISMCDKSEHVKLKHTKNVNYRLYNTRYILEKATEKFHSVEKTLKILAEKPCTNQEAEHLIAEIITGKKQTISTRAKNIISVIQDYYDRETKPSYLSLLNSFAEYFMHNRSSRGELKEEARFDSCMFGSSADAMQEVICCLKEK